MHILNRPSGLLNYQYVLISADWLSVHQEKTDSWLLENVSLHLVRTVVENSRVLDETLSCFD